MVIIGKIINTHGLGGFVKVKSFTDFDFRFSPKSKVNIKISDNSSKIFSIEKSYFRNNFVFLKFENLDSISEAENILNCELFINEEDLVPLEKGTYYIHDLIGMKVVDEFGNDAGEVIDVYQLPSNDIYEAVDPTGKKFLIPAVKEFFEIIDSEKKYLKLKTNEGILD